MKLLEFKYHTRKLLPHLNKETPATVTWWLLRVWSFIIGFLFGVSRIDSADKGVFVLRKMLVIW